MERNKRIETIIYGGAFNPPTLAHIAILQACAEYARSKQADVWLMPSGERSDKSIGVSKERRIAYIDAMIADTDMSDVATHILTTELDRTTAIETFDTVLELDQAYPEREFRWVFGADSTETMADWQNGEVLLENLSMLVVERDGYTINPLAKRAIALSIPQLSISSTMVRARLAAHEHIDDLVGPSVLSLLV